MFSGRVSIGTKPKLRVAIFGSFYRGYETINNILNDKELMDRVEIVGTVPDDPSQPYSSPNKRLWQHPHTPEEETMVEELAKRKGIPVFKGRVKSQEFYDKLEKEWKPDVIYMTLFGQILDKKILSIPKLGAFNTHSSTGEVWPSFVGGNPVQEILEARKPYFAVALHEANEKIDNGNLACFSERIPIPYAELDLLPTLGHRAMQLQKLIAPYAADLINAHLRCEVGLQLTPRQKGFAQRLINDRSGKDDAQIPAG